MDLLLAGMVGPSNLSFPLLEPPMQDFPISKFLFLIQELIPEFKNPFLHSVHRSGHEPFQRCLEQNQMILLPHRVVR